MIRTDRLLLRPWSDDDLASFAKMNADPRVREFFASVLTREQSDADVRHYQTSFARDGYCFFAAEVIATGQFAGMIGMQTMSFAVPNVTQPAVEVGWRLSTDYWGSGLATEGAQAVLRYAFKTRLLPEVVAITATTNVRSRHVMDKLGMRYHPDLDFDSPRAPVGHPVRPHVLYALRREDYLARHLQARAR